MSDDLYEQLNEAKLLPDLLAGILGTTDQITVTDNGDGTLTLSLPSNVVIDSATVNYLQMVVDADPTLAVGQIGWDEDDHTIKWATGLGNVIQGGQELWGVGVNKTGGTALDGYAVYASGTQGNRLTYDYADAREAIKSGFVGVVTYSTANNAEGPVTTFGYVRNLDTSGYTVGSKLYIAADGTGVLTDTAPSAPNFVVWVATVTNTHGTQGEIFVSPRIDFSNGVTFTSLDINDDLSVGGDTTGKNRAKQFFYAGF